MRTRAVLLAAVLAAAGAAGWLLLRAPPAEEPAEEPGGRTTLRDTVDSTHATGATVADEEAKTGPAVGGPQAAELLTGEGRRSPRAEDVVLDWRKLLSIREGAPLRVLSDATTGLPGAQVRIWLHRGETRDLVGTAVSDANGFWVPDLSAYEAIPPILRAAGTFRIDVNAEGFLPSLVQETSNAWMFWMDRGKVLHGRIVTAMGDPVRDAQVALQGRSMKDGRWAETVRVWVDSEGRFELALPPEGRRGNLSVTSRAHGSLRRPLDVDGTRDLTVPDVVLEGPALLEGRVVFEDGSPAPEVEVLGCHWGAAFDQDLPGTAGGLVTATTRTSPDGRFVLRGLAEGHWSVLVPAFAGQVPMEEVVHATGAKDVVLRAPGVRIRLRVTDDAGRPAPGVWLATWGVQAPEGGLLRDAGGLVDLWARPGAARVTVGARPSKAYPWTEASLELAPGRFDHAMHLVLRPDDGQRGTLRLRLVFADGAPIPRADVRVNSVSGAWLLQRELTAQDGWFTLPPLWPGPVRLDVSPGPVQDVDSLEDTYWFPATTDALVEANRTRDVEVRVRQGARLRITARTSEAVVEERATLRLQGPGETASRPVPRFYSASPESPYPLDGALRLRFPYVVADVLEPGTYKVTLHAGAQLQASREVVLRAGQTTALDVTLERP